MSSHRAEGARRTASPRRSGRVRALIALAAVVVLATGLSVKGTFAFWTDSATLKSGEFNSGTLDITLDGQLVGPGNANNPGSYTPNGLTFAMANMVPGESIAYSFPVKNNGSTPLTYTVTGTGAGPLAVANGMQYSVIFGNATNAAATNTGDPSANNRKGACGTAPGTPSTDTNTTLLTGTAVGFGGTNRALAVGATEQVCIVARFNSTAGNGLQNSNPNGTTPTTASFLFDAKQVGAP